MKRASLVRSLRLPTRMALLIPLVGLLAACATSQPTNQADAKKAATAEQVADRIDARLDHRN